MTELEEAMEFIAAAKEAGAIPLCGRCRDVADLAMFCDGSGTFQGVACNTCWAAHLDYIEISAIAIASGMYQQSCCSACGVDDVPTNHIMTRGI
jgi:hypothetical protein